MNTEVKRTFGIEERSSINDMARTVRVVASTDAIDSYGEVVDQSWNLDRYKRNPVVLYNHASSWRKFEETLPIGKAVECAVVNGRLEATIKFADAKTNPIAEQVWRCVKEGLLNAVSVGFAPRNIREEKRNGVDTLVLSDNELFEISVVPLPANGDAVVLSADRKDSREALLALARKAASSGDGDTMTDEQETPAQPLEEKATPDFAARIAELTATNSELAEKAARVTELLEKIASLESEKAELLDQIAVRDVDALVGVKFLPAEREEMLEIRRSNKSLFERLMSKRSGADITALKTQTTQPETAAPKTELAAGSAGLAKAANKRAGIE